MRVAVVFPAGRPESGGSYTFQETVATAIRASTSHGQGRHEFVFFVDDSSSGGAATDTGWSGAHPVVKVPASKPARIWRKGQFLINHAQDLLIHRRHWELTTAFVRLLKRYEIEFVWFATQHFLECPLPYLTTIFDLQHQNQPWFPEVGSSDRWITRESVTRRAVSRASVVVVANEQAERELLRAYPIGAERVLQLGHPTPHFALEAAVGPKGQYPYHLGIDGDYLLYPAQFWPHKNHATLLKAFAQLRKRGMNLTLVLVGSDKGNRAHIESLARELGLTHHTRMLGFVGLPDLVALYQHARALVYTSLFGPENLPPLEAFALGCPVVCAEYAGAREQLGPAAYLVDPLDARALADALIHVLTDPDERTRLIDAGRLRAAALSADKYVAGVTRFLDRFALVRENWK